MDAPLHGVALVRLEDPTVPLFTTEHYFVFWKGHAWHNRYDTYGEARAAFDANSRRVVEALAA